MNALADPAAEFRQRLRFVAGALAVAFPLAWAASFHPWNRPYDRAGHALGADFPVFHAFATLAAEGGPALYDLPRQRAVQFATLPELHPSTFLPALYPPFVAAALRPLAGLPYSWAFAAFAAGNAALLALAFSAWRRHLSWLRGRWAGTAALLVAGCPLVQEGLLGGQASAWGVAAFGIAGAWLAAAAGEPRRRTAVLAGAVLGLAFYKPNLLALPIMAIACRYPWTIVGLAFSASALLLAGGLAEGWDAWSAWLRLMADPSAQQALGAPPVHKFHGLAATAPFLRGPLGKALCGGACLAAGLALAWHWRRAARRGDEERGAARTPLALALLGTLGLLGNPYVPTYDLALLVPIGMFAAEGCCRAGMSLRPAAAAGWLAAGCFGPLLSQEIAKATGWQPFSLVLAAFAGFLTAAYRHASGTVPRTR